jgi:hypothetical protein
MSLTCSGDPFFPIILRTLPPLSSTPNRPKSPQIPKPPPTPSAPRRISTAIRKSLILLNMKGRTSVRPCLKTLKPSSRLRSPTRLLLAAVCRFGWEASMHARTWIVTSDARNRAQVLVDSTNIAIRQVLKIRPGHDLQKIPVERRIRRVRRKAACHYGSRAIWMQVIKILACPHDRKEFFKRVIPFRQSCLC